MNDKILPYLRLIRPAHWVKNLLVFAPVFFVGRFFDLSVLVPAALAAAAFSCAASGVYAANDVLDAEADKIHPYKKGRPVASGRISTHSAGMIAAALLALGIGVAVFVSGELAFLIAGYALLNSAYSLGWKHVAVADIAVVASFYVMRIYAGSMATGIPVSPWLALCGFFLALFLVTAKRMAESARSEGRRKVLDEYTDGSLDLILGVTASLTLAAYSLWASFSGPGPLAKASVIFVFIGIGRYALIAHDAHRAELPEKALFRDKAIVISVLLWLVFLGIELYPGIL